MDLPSQPQTRPLTEPRRLLAFIAFEKGREEGLAVWNSGYGMGSEAEGSEVQGFNRGHVLGSVESFRN